MFQVWLNRLDASAEKKVFHHAQELSAASRSFISDEKLCLFSSRLSWWWWTFEQARYPIVQKSSRSTQLSAGLQEGTRLGEPLSFAQVHQRNTLSMKLAGRERERFQSTIKLYNLCVVIESTSIVRFFLTTLLRSGSFPLCFFCASKEIATRPECWSVG